VVKKTVTRNKMRGATSARKTKSHAAAPKLSAQAALSFLKETKGALTWTAQEFARGVGITVAEAGPALAVLQMQGYIKPVEGKNEWMTSVDGDAVSGAAAPRFSSEAVKKALVDLRGRIAAVNKDAKADFRVASAIAFGDFLLDRAQAQAADVGIELARRNARDAKRISKAEERAFLKTLRAGKQIIRLIPLEPWMRERAHLRIH
jgi:hypothetical protein